MTYTAAIFTYSRWFECVECFSVAFQVAIVADSSSYYLVFTPITNARHFMLISVNRNSHCVLASS